MGPMPQLTRTKAMAVLNLGRILTDWHEVGLGPILTIKINCNNRPQMLSFWLVSLGCNVLSHAFAMRSHDEG